MLAQSSGPEPIFQLLESIGPEPLAAIMIIGTIGGIAITIVSITLTLSTINNITTMRMSQSMVKNLLEKGYSVEDVERLVFGGKPWGRRGKKLIRTARSRWQNQPLDSGQHPMPPVKQTA